MISIRLGSLHKGQTGLTLVELLIAIVLVGIVTAGITMTIGHMFAWTTRTNNHMTAVRQVQSAGYWFSRDALQAQNVTPPDTSSENPSGTRFPLTMSWKRDNTQTTVVYHVTPENRLQRHLTIITDGEVTLETTSFVAQHIDVTIDEEDGLRRTLITLPTAEGATAIFRVTATVGGQSETREYQARPRPDAPDQDD